MKTTEFKADCTLDMGGLTYAGLAHVILIEYSDRITFCNAVMTYTDDDCKPGGTPSATQNIGVLTLPDGRTAVVLMTHGQIYPYNYNEFGLAGRLH